MSDQPTWPLSLRRRLRSLPRNVVALGVVSFVADFSSEMIYPVFPGFVTRVLGASAAILGLIEGSAEATASLTRYPFGRLSDELGRRRPFVLGGYGLATLGKLVLALAFIWPVALGGRVLDRVGKGMRTAPRDALLSSDVRDQDRGLAFGLHRTMDTAGAVVGPLTTLLLLQLGVSLRWVFALAVVPGALSVAVIWRSVRERAPRATRAPAAFAAGDTPRDAAGPRAATPRDAAGPAATPAAARRERSRLRLPASRRFRRLLVASLVFAVGNSSNAFILLKASAVGYGAKGVILVYVLYNLTYAAGSLPLGGLSDRVGQFPVVAGGLLVFAAVYAGFAAAKSMALVAVLFAAYGLYIAATEGTTKALISRTAPEADRASAMGFFDTSIGLASFAASAIGGLLWTVVGSWATFAYGAVAAAIAAVLLTIFARGIERPPEKA
ncbi:MAG: MFS transporter [Thermoleophilia bacterium]|jgi:MFS family permease